MKQRKYEQSELNWSKRLSSRNGRKEYVLPTNGGERQNRKFMQDSTNQLHSSIQGLRQETKQEVEQLRFDFQQHEGQINRLWKEFELLKQNPNSNFKRGDLRKIL